MTQIRRIHTDFFCEMSNVRCELRDMKIEMQNVNLNAYSFQIFHPTFHFSIISANP